jgi:acyl-CoA reductase-like NAD-dependent aldehyde dehydrogenase
MASATTSSELIETPEKRVLIGGEWLESDTWDEILSPFSGAVVGRVPVVGADAATDAVQAAETAMRTPLPAWQRAEILDRTAALISDHLEELARLLVDETGKPIKAARMEVGRAAFTYRLAGGAARTMTGEAVPVDASPAGEQKVGFT